ncbi:MAG: hypothetical protein VYE68_10305 [Acidobacteriota bacterium]|nr:hypothetical protein [Acidobacteriota bacterium]
MIRTLIQLNEDTYERLRKRAFHEHRSVASLVRDFVSIGLDGETSRTRPRDVRALASVGAGHSRRGRLAPVSEKHDDALAEAFES